MQRAKKNIVIKARNEVETLKAIGYVRSDLVYAIESGNMPAAHEASQRLLSLYACLNVNNVIIAIDRFVKVK